MLEYSEAQTVSVDYNGNPHSAIVDATNTFVIDGNLAKVMAWYDNEWGFSNRMVDLTKLRAGEGLRRRGEAQPCSAPSTICS